MPHSFRPVSPDALVVELADTLSAVPRPGPALRVAIDGADAAGPLQLAEGLVGPLRERGNPATVIDARTFWRDASVRLEYGREDVDEFSGWLDAPALRREVLSPLGPDGTGRFLPSLRDPVTNRATRVAAVDAETNAVVIVAGAFLLGLGLPFDHVVHLVLSPGALRRRTPPPQAWTLPAFARYDAEVDPVALADVVVRLDDPARPAVRR